MHYWSLVAWIFSVNSFGAQILATQTTVVELELAASFMHHISNAYFRVITRLTFILLVNLFTNGYFMFSLPLSEQMQQKTCICSSNI